MMSIIFIIPGTDSRMDSCLKEMGRSRENVVTPQDLYDCFAGIEGKNVLIMDWLLQRHDGFADQEHWAAESLLKTQSAGMRQQKLLSISLRKVLHRQKKKIRDFRVGRC